MTKISVSNKDITEQPQKIVRLVITEDTPSSHRLAETTEGLEYRMGVGKWSEMTARKFITLIRSIVQTAKNHQIEYLAIQLSNSPFPKLNALGEAWVTSAIAENLLLAAYEYDTHKTKDKDAKTLKEIIICGGMSKEATAGFKRGEIIGYYTNQARDIANTPGSDMTPQGLAEAAKTVAKGTNVKVKVLDLPAIKKEKMGALVAVGGGAKDKPRFIVMEYMGGKKGEKPVVFCGKGITFDTGGLQIKPGMAMYEMHMDMSGGASVIAAISAAAKLGVKKNIVALIPAAENGVGEEAMRPGDIIKTMSGKTVEVLHTDAEGRLVLADALHYAKRYEPKLVIDVATLTGAALVALGQHAHAIMTTDRELEDTLRELGEKSGDYVHPLPLWEEYKQYTKGTHADISNISSGDGKYGGSINGGMFLSHFAEEMKWVHIDMAPRMTSVASDKLAKGATGEPVRLLIAIAEEL